MNEQPTKENTLYLPIKQVYFDQIIAGTKTEEFREIKDTTAKKYLLTAPDGKPLKNPEVTEPGKEYFIEDYNGGRFPFLPKPYMLISPTPGTISRPWLTAVLRAASAAGDMSPWIM